MNNLFNRDPSWAKHTKKQNVPDIKDLLKNRDEAFSKAFANIPRAPANPTETAVKDLADAVKNASDADDQRHGQSLKAQEAGNWIMGITLVISLAALVVAWIAFRASTTAPLAGQ